MRSNVRLGPPPPPPGWSPPPGWATNPSILPVLKGWVWWIFAQLGPAIDKNMRRAVRWAQLRAGRRSFEEPPVVTAPPTGHSRWADLAQASVTLALAGSGVPGAESALGVIRALYDIEDDQTRMLRSIEYKVGLLQQGPFRAGRLLINEARRLGPADPEYQRMLAAARNKFYEAQPLAASVQDRAVVEMHLGLVWQAIGRPKHARYWLEQSYQTAGAVITALAAECGDVKILHSRWSTAALTYFYPMGLFVIPAKLKKVWSAERARDAIGEFLPFINCVAASLSALNKSGAFPALELTGSRAEGFVLCESPA